MKYVVIFERGKEGQENWGAYVPDLPGVGTVGDTFEEVQANIREAVTLHIEGMIEDGETLPEPVSVAGMIDTNELPMPLSCNIAA